MQVNDWPVSGKLDYFIIVHFWGRGIDKAQYLGMHQNPCAGTGSGGGRRSARGVTSLIDFGSVRGLVLIYSRLTCLFDPAIFLIRFNRA